MKKQEIDLNKLKQLWETTDLTMSDIGKALNTSYDVVRNRINKNNFIRPQELIDSCEQKRRNKISKCENRHKYKNMKQEYYCYFCNTKFIPTQNQYSSIKQNKPIFCSVKCRNNYLNNNNTIHRPKLTCYICGKDIECTPDRFTRYRQGKDKFFCSRSCVMKYSWKHINITEKNKIHEALYNDPDWVAKRTLKTRITNINRYGTDNQFKRDEVKQQASVTKLKRYKNAYYNNREKAAKTLYEHYGNNAILTNKISKVNKKFYDFIEGDCFEFALDNYNYDIKKNDVLIEIDPSFTHHSLEYKFKGIYGSLDINYHKNKTLTAHKHNYKCIHIFDWDDWNKIKYILQDKETLYARKLHIKEVSIEDTTKFLNEYHLQDTCKGQVVRLGLYKDNKLIQIMTFGKPRYNKNYEWELLRLCTHKDYKVVGGSEKLFKCFVTSYEPKSIISYCDFSKFKGDIYNQLGFKQIGYSTPSKHWSKGNKQITDNLLRQRGYDQLFNTNYGKNTSNEQLMVDNGWLPVYDCGQLTFVWQKEAK